MTGFQGNDKMGQRPGSSASDSDEMWLLKPWHDLSRWERRAKGALIALDVGLLLAAARDLRRRLPDQLRGSRRLWSVLIFIDYLGPLAYFLFGRKGSGCADP